MTRPIEDIEVDLRKIAREIQKLRTREVELKKERDERRVFDAEAEPHPWLGKRVKHVDRQRIRTGWRTTGYKDVTFRGTVIVMTREHRRLTGLGYRKPGDLVVISNTGKKGWPLHRGWKLDEEQS